MPYPHQQTYVPWHRGIMWRLRFAHNLLTKCIELRRLPSRVYLRDRIWRRGDRLFVDGVSQLVCNPWPAPRAASDRGRCRFEFSDSPYGLDRLLIPTCEFRTVFDGAAAGLSPEAQRRAMDKVTSVPLDEGALAALEWFESCFPARLYDAIRPYRAARWRLICVAAITDCDAACDLMHSNPGLALALADDLPTLEQMSDQMRTRLLFRKQKQILEQFGGTTAGTLARALARIDPMQCEPFHVGQFIKACETLPRKQRRWLIHAGRVTGEAIGLAMLASNPDYSRMITHRLFEDACHNLAPKEGFTVTSRLELAVQRWNELFPGKPLPRLDSIRSVNHFAADVDDHEARYASREGWLETSFPPPPVPGTERIEPLESPMALVREGAEQRHCLGRPGIDVMSVIRGRSYFYRVLAPKRATLEIGRRTDRWTIKELAGPHNRKVNAATRQMVEQWCERHQDQDKAGQCR